ncbi:MAG: GGDEF domain-containing protein [Micromonosporaceae bacterium]|nr:GGDEF domain-containing protein [Micromonosporaceae bacterium]
MRGRPVLTTYLAACTALVTALILSPNTVRTGILFGVGLLPIAAVLISFKVNQVADRLPWMLIIAGMAQLSVVNGIWFAKVGLGGAETADSFLTMILQMGGYLSILAASVVVVLRHSPNDAGSVIDAALLGLAAAVPMWEFVMHPRLTAAGVPASAQSATLLQTLALLAVGGSILRISRTSGRDMISLRYLFAALAWTICGITAATVLVDVVSDSDLPYAGICWLLGYTSIAAGAIHPTAADFTKPAKTQKNDLSPIRLARLGTFLLLIPIVGGIPPLLGRQADVLLLSLGPLVTTPLVLTRIGQLVAQRVKDQQTLAYQASHDELTGLFNRRQLFLQAETLHDRCVGGEFHSLAALYCDLDGFKPVNDRYGHDAGDEVLRVVGQRLTGCVRAQDVVGRVGGDEFLVICPGGGTRDTEALRLRIERVVADPILWLDVQLCLGVTVGVAATPRTDPVSIDELVAMADEDMYVRKRERKARAGLAPISRPGQS